MDKYIKKTVCIVISNTPLNDFRYHIDSVWYSRKKAERRRDELNSDKKAKWREEYGYGFFDVEIECISK